MPGQRVEITYEAFVKGVERIEDLVRKNKDLQDSVQKYEQTIKKQNVEQEKHISGLTRARTAILAFRRAIFPIVFLAASVAGGLKLLSSSSDAFAERMESLTTNVKNFVLNALTPMANALARLFGNKGQLSRGARIDILGLQAETAKLQGDELTALLKKQEAERIKLLEGASDERKRIIEKELLVRQAAEREALRLAELGLKSQITNIRDFQRDIVGAFRGGASDVLFKFLQGEKQSGADIFKTFATGINRAVADAVTNALFTSLFKGGGFFENLKNLFTGRTAAVIAQEKTTTAVEKANDTLVGIARCVCDTAANTAAILGARSRVPTSASITMPKGSSLGAIGSIIGGVGALAGGVAGLAGLANLASAGAGSVPSFTMGAGALATGRYGGWAHLLPRYQTGGEVPAILHPGEFVMNAQASQSNKGLLKSMNSGGGAQVGNNFYVSIKANDATSFNDMLASSSARQTMSVNIIKLIMENSEVRRVIKDFAK